MIKSTISRILRKSGLLYFSDKLHFLYQRNINNKRNQLFKKEHPGFILPPAYILYESYRMDHYKYYQDGINTAKWITGHFSKYTELKNLHILDWGCGPGRVVRHLPGILDENCRISGTDYNKTTIEWCRKNIQKVFFSENELSPPLRFDNESIDIVYGISIFTHLSEEMHQAWIRELSRILKSGGLLLITTQGEAFSTKLTRREKEIFEKGHLVIRGKTKEGHRTYSAFQPEIYMRKLFGNFEILEMIKGEVLNNNKPQQDVWILRK
jgi:ubiquinone/menaquinone biosynthesis C-methylase UbiE